MEKLPFNGQFGQTKKALETSTKEAKDLLQTESMNEKDMVRLTRVLQLVERYQPKREVEEEKIREWKNYLKTVFRFLPNLRKTKDVPLSVVPKSADRISAESYLLAEKTISILRELRKIDFDLKNETGFSDEEILCQERSKKVLSKETLDTSITLDYEKKNWNVERICLDGVQNHLPSDSKGENVWIQCLVSGKWISLQEAKSRKANIRAVRFVDDGVGFDVKNLSLLYSTKADEKESRGQFGEGIKMISAAALREGLELELESHDWRATPIAKKVKLFNTRDKKNESVQQLAFEVDHLEGKPMIGSRTTFHEPTPKFIEELLQIEKKVLALRENYRPMFVGKSGEIVNTESSGIYVKGIYINNSETLFSYNFEDIETNRDRNSVISHDLGKRIAKIIGEISDKKLIKTLLKKSILETDAIECSSYEIEVLHPIVWTEAFYEAFGQDAVLDTGFEMPEAFSGKKLNLIKLPRRIKDAMLDVKIKTDREAVPDFYKETIPTSLTLEYGKENWNEERILLDAVQNHLPYDSGGTNIGLRFKTKDGYWKQFEDLDRHEDEEITAIKIYDNGRGYDPRLLGFFYSTKDASESAGKFGEGLKMLSIAALRKGIEMELHSQNWVAKPRAKRQEINGKEIDQLVFDVTYSVAKKHEKLDPDGDHIRSSSSTTFISPTKELLDEFRNIHKKVLSLVEDNDPIERTNAGDILSLEGGMMYVKRLLIPGDHNLLFTYHLKNLEIKDRDRNFLDQRELGSAISQIWSEVDRADPIKSFLFKANLEARKGEGKNKLEFSTKFQPRDHEQWKKIFQEIFGENTAIRDVRSEDYDAMQQNKHVGLELVTFPTPVYESLSQIGIPTYKERINEMTDVEHIPNDELTRNEIHMLDVLSAIDKYLPGNRPSDIRVYQRKYPGQKIASGFSDKNDVHLLRDILSSFEDAADVYVHEKTHHNTDGAKDASSDFRNYLSFALGKMALERLEKERPELMKK